MANWMFASQEAPVTEPPLPEDFGVGSSILVLGGTSRCSTTMPATVVKKGRVWVTVAPVDGPPYLVWRFRLDTQTDGSDHGFPMHFRTPEQQRYREVSVDAALYLHTIGVRIEYDSPVRRVALARLIYRSGLVPDPGKS